MVSGTCDPALALGLGLSTFKYRPWGCRTVRGGARSRQTPRPTFFGLHSALRPRRTRAGCVLTHLMSEWAGLVCARGTLPLPPGPGPGERGHPRPVGNG